MSKSNQTKYEKFIEKAKKSNKPVTIQFKTDDGFLPTGPYSIRVYASKGWFSSVNLGDYQHIRKGVIDPEGIKNVQKQALEKAIEVAEKMTENGLIVSIMGDSVSQAKENLKNFE